MHEICFDEDEDAECRQELTLWGSYPETDQQNKTDILTLSNQEFQNLYDSPWMMIKQTLTVYPVNV